jgi:precorrin-3B methylase
MKANTNHSKSEQTLEGIINPFNSKLKKQFSETIEFIRDYKSGYTPIELQNRSKKEDEKEAEEGKKEKEKS